MLFEQPLCEICCTGHCPFLGVVAEGLVSSAITFLPSFAVIQMRYPIPSEKKLLKQTLNQVKKSQIRLYGNQIFLFSVRTTPLLTFDP